jgi:hypothetical protein
MSTSPPFLEDIEDAKETRCRLLDGEPSNLELEPVEAEFDTEPEATDSNAFPGDAGADFNRILAVPVVSDRLTGVTARFCLVEEREEDEKELS